MESKQPPPGWICEALEKRLRAELARIRETLRVDETVVQNSDYPLPSVFQKQDGGWHLAGLRSNKPMQPAKVGDVLDHLDNMAPGMAAEEAARLIHGASLIEPESHRTPAIERLVDTWPWCDVINFERPEFAMLCTLRQMTYARRHPNTSGHDIWRAVTPTPGDVAPIDVMHFVGAGLDRINAGAGQQYTDYCTKIATDIQTTAWLGAVTLDYELAPETSWPYPPANGPFIHYIEGEQLSWLYKAARDIEADRTTPSFRVSATGESRAIIAMLSAGPPTGKPDKDGLPDLSPWKEAKVDETTKEVRLVWDGKTTPYQLVLLDDPELLLEAQVVHGILKELKADGLRDWLTLHRMAGLQGNTGRFRWTWAEHREITGYANRVKRKTYTDADLAEQVKHRLWRMKRAELRAERPGKDGKIEWVRIGPHGLIDVMAGQDENTTAGRITTVAAVQINEVLYRGAEAQTKNPRFALLPEKALTLAPNELQLFTLMTFPWLYSGKGKQDLKAKTLWGYAGIRKGNQTERKRWPEARRTLEKHLGNLERKLEIKITGGGDGPDAVYSTTAPQWWRDRVVHRVKPLPSQSTAHLPRTGKELKEARKAIGKSQREVAAALGVSAMAVSRAEKGGDRALPSEWIAKLAGTHLPLPKPK